MIRLLSKHLNYLFVRNNFFYPRVKLDYLSNCLDIYYKCLTLPFDVPSLIKDVKKLF